MRAKLKMLVNKKVYLVGKPLLEAQSMYFRFKNETFKGNRPYDAAPLEDFMKKEFGEYTTMNEIKGIK